MLRRDVGRRWASTVYPLARHRANHPLVGRWMEARSRYERAEASAVLAGLAAMPVGCGAAAPRAAAIPTLSDTEDTMPGAARA